MKKVLAIVLTLCFILSLAPLALAQETEEKFERSSDAIKKINPDYRTQTAVNNDGTVVEVADTHHRLTAISTDDVRKDRKTISAKQLNEKAGWLESYRASVPLIDQEESLLGGYWLSDADGTFTLTNDWYTDGRDTFTQILYINDGEEGGTLQQFEQGESVFINYDIYRTFDMGSQTLVPLDDSVEVGLNIYMFAGTYDDYLGETGTGIQMRYAWVTGANGISMKLTAPEDDWVYMIVAVLSNTTMNEFGAWITPSSYETYFKDIDVSTDKMKVDETMDVDVGGVDTDMVLINYDTKYVLTNGAVYPIELEGGSVYVLDIDSADSIGAHVMVTDENLDVITETWIGAEAVAGGVPYKNVRMLVMPVVSGTYHVFAGGFYYGDEGELSVTVWNWSSLTSNQIPFKDYTIDLGSLGTEDYVDDDLTWGYFWYPSVSMGELILSGINTNTGVYGRTYTITGSNENVFCDIYDGASVVLDNATIGGVWPSNKTMSTLIEANNSTIADSYFGQTIYNYEGCNSGLYITGESLTVTGTIGLYIDGAPLHLSVKSLTVDTVPAEGNYPSALWVVGKDNCKLTVDGYPTFDGENQLANMWYEDLAYYFFGYTVATVPDVYRLHVTQDSGISFYQIAEYFEMTLDGEAPTEVKVTFKDGVTGGTISSVTIPFGSDVDFPTPPKHDGYTFKNWDNSGKNITRDTVITAIYEKIGDGPQPTPPVGDVFYGDANCDGEVNTGDATTVLKHSAGLLTLSGKGLANADANNDREVNTGDATTILKYAAGLISKLPPQ